MEELGDDGVGDPVVDAGAEVDDPVGEQPAVDVDGPLAVAAAGRDVGDRVAAHQADTPRCIPVPTAPSRSRASARHDVVERAHDGVDEPVVQRLLRGEPPVAARVLLDLLDRLPGVLGDARQHRVAGVA